MSTSPASSTNSTSGSTIRSMTGYGRAHRTPTQPGTAAECGVFTIGVEIKSVNSRHLDVKWRYPARLRSMEREMERHVRAHAQRGRVEISITLESCADTAQTRTGCSSIRLDCATAAAMLSQLATVASNTPGALDTVDPSRLLNVSHLWSEDDYAPAEDAREAILHTLDNALADWNTSRSTEGAALVHDLTTRFAIISERVAAIATQVPEVLARKKAALAQRIAEGVAEAGHALDEGRLHTEVVLLADKLDVSEELTRLDAHFTRLRDTLSDGGEAGKRLDFLLQETFREVNTCGNKAQDPTISGLIVECKTELEKCREQVQNIE